MTNVSQSRSVSHAGFWAIIITVATLDLWSKAAIVAWLAPARRPIEVTPFFNLRLGYNPGISFGLFPAEGEVARAILIGFTLLMALVISWLGLRSQSGTERAGFALIAGEALGNVIDRGSDGLVTDFLDIHVFGWHWPTFNLADVAITCGVVMLLFASFLVSRFENSLQDPKP